MGGTAITIVLEHGQTRMALADESDDELMARLKGGEHAAFPFLFRRHTPAVFGLCLRIFAGDKARAEDVTQEVWVRVARHAKGYEASGKFKPWLMRIARNAALTEISRNRALVELNAETEATLADEFHLEDDLMAAQDTSQIKAAIDELPDGQRVALLLWIEGGKSYEEIAAELRTNPSCLKSLLYRAKQSLARKLKR